MGYFEDQIEKDRKKRKKCVCYACMGKAIELKKSYEEIEERKHLENFEL